MSADSRGLADILARWSLADADVRPLGRGLINETLAVEGSRPGEGAGRWVLQRVNPIFDARIHENIAAVTGHLERKGLRTPALVPTDAGAWWLEVDPGEGGAGTWRLQTAISGVSVDALDDPAQARAAGRFVGRWHAAVADLDHDFVALRLGVHDTPRHLGRLREAVDRPEHAQHRLYEAVAALAEGLFAAAESLPPLPPSLPRRVAHGDLKINNLLFAGEAGPGRLEPVALIDLDTLAPMHLGHELGDAWRSWTNRAGEDQAQAQLDLELFTESFRGWQAGWVEGGGEALGADERQALLVGPEWISLELACRFAADALFEDYFGWDRERFAGRGEHNLHRARGQWSLHEALAGARGARSAVIDEEARG